jgi:hypothetical protein
MRKLAFCSWRTNEALQRVYDYHFVSHFVFFSTNEALQRQVASHYQGLGFVT